ncbi:hypothetical protein MMC21_001141 [Puttea exsequens]|nr:hypothetical protein [Puttea exsequens]
MSGRQKRIHLDDFREIKIHTAKCDSCNEHNRQTIYRCFCGIQHCTPCFSLKSGKIGMHELTKFFPASSNQATHTPLSSSGSTENALGGRGTATAGFMTVSNDAVVESQQRSAKPRNHEHHRSSTSYSESQSKKRKASVSSSGDSLETADDNSDSLPTETTRPIKRRKQAVDLDEEGSKADPSPEMLGTTFGRRAARQVNGMNVNARRIGSNSGLSTFKATTSNQKCHQEAASAQSSSGNEHSSKPTSEIIQIKSHEATSSYAVHSISHPASSKATRLSAQAHSLQTPMAPTQHNSNSKEAAVSLLELAGITRSSASSSSSPPPSNQVPAPDDAMKPGQMASPYPWVNYTKQSIIQAPSAPTKRSNIHDLLRPSDELSSHNPPVSANEPETSTPLPPVDYKRRRAVARDAYDEVQSTKRGQRSKFFDNAYEPMWKLGTISQRPQEKVPSSAAHTNREPVFQPADTISDARRVKSTSLSPLSLAAPKGGEETSGSKQQRQNHNAQLVRGS